eukprot:SM000282S10597  [mRNA]  locus=s282:40699:42989:+ [translate_table: standard]
MAMYSPQFFTTCTLGGAVACGPTHAAGTLAWLRAPPLWLARAVTPLDMVKTNMQADPIRYKSIGNGFRLVWAEQGLPGIVRGWLPTFIGYSFQGAFKYGGYEYFKKMYSDMVGPEYAKKYKDLIYIAGSASAEFFADIALCPFEAVKVRVQTQPGFAHGMHDGMPKMIAAEGVAGLYKGLVPLWGRQIPYTIMKFLTFERTVEYMYSNVVPYPKAECSKQYQVCSPTLSRLQIAVSIVTVELQGMKFKNNAGLIRGVTAGAPRGLQLGVSFVSGYIAGIFSTVVSQPADNIVSLMNKGPGLSASDAIKQLGLQKLFTRGLPLRLVQIGTLTGLQWAIYDTVKVVSGIPTSGDVDKVDARHEVVPAQ